MKVLTFKAGKGVQTQSLRVVTQLGFVSHTFAEASGIPGESYVDLVEAKPRLDCSLHGLGLG